MLEHTSNLNSNDSVRVLLRLLLHDGTVHRLPLDIMMRKSTLSDVIASTESRDEVLLSAPPGLLDSWLECLQHLQLALPPDPGGNFRDTKTSDLIEYLKVRSVYVLCKSSK